MDKRVLKKLEAKIGDASFCALVRCGQNASVTSKQKLVSRAEPCGAKSATNIRRRFSCSS